MELLQYLLHAIPQNIPAGLLRFASRCPAIIHLKLTQVPDGRGDQHGEEPAGVEGFAGLSGNAEDRLQSRFGAAGTDADEEVADAKNSFGVTIGENFGWTVFLGVRKREETRQC